VDVKKLVDRVRDLMLSPRETLPLTLAESGEPRDVLIPYVMVLAALGPIAGFLSTGVIGMYIPAQSIFNTTVPAMYVRAPFAALLVSALRFGMGIASWWCLALVYDKLAPGFGGKHDRAGAFKASASTLTPLWLAGALSLFNSVPHLDFLGYVGGVAALAYAVLIGMYAVPLQLSTPEPKAVGHVLASLGITVVATAISYVLVTSLVVWPFFGSFLH
jgi:Yip1 domain